MRPPKPPALPPTASALLGKSTLPCQHPKPTSPCNLRRVTVSCAHITEPDPHDAQRRKKPFRFDLERGEFFHPDGRFDANEPVAIGVLSHDTLTVDVEFEQHACPHHPEITLETGGAPVSTLDAHAVFEKARAPRFEDDWYASRLKHATTPMGMFKRIASATVREGTLVVTSCGVPMPAAAGKAAPACACLSIPVLVAPAERVELRIKTPALYKRSWGRAKFVDDDLQRKLKKTSAVETIDGSVATTTVGDARTLSVMDHGGTVTTKTRPGAAPTRKVDRDARKRSFAEEVARSVSFTVITPARRTPIEQNLHFFADLLDFIEMLEDIAVAIESPDEIGVPVSYLEFGASIECLAGDLDAHLFWREKKNYSIERVIGAAIELTLVRLALELHVGIMIDVPLADLRVIEGTLGISVDGAISLRGSIDRCRDLITGASRSDGDLRLKGKLDFKAGAKTQVLIVHASFEVKGAFTSELHEDDRNPQFDLDAEWGFSGLTYDIKIFVGVKKRAFGHTFKLGKEWHPATGPFTLFDLHKPRSGKWF
ncbi:MAG: hypothetical protein U0414_09430 [Polyangiaceae bacterium]